MPKKEISTSDHVHADDLQKLGEKVKSAQKARQPQIDEDTSGWAVGINYASVFTGAIIIGGAFGFTFDYFVNTKPWGLAIGIMFGFAAGTRSIVQMAQKMNEENE